MPTRVKKIVELQINPSCLCAELKLLQDFYPLSEAFTKTFWKKKIMIIHLTLLFKCKKNFRMLPKVCIWTNGDIFLLQNTNHYN